MQTTDRFRIILPGIRIGGGGLLGISKTRQEVPPVSLWHIRKSALILIRVFLGLMTGVVSAMADDTDNYDLNTEVVFEGTVTQELARARGPRVFLVESGDTTYRVMSGPWWYLEEIGLTIEKGMKIEVTGSKLYDPKGDLSLIIYSLKDLNSGKTYSFRDDKLTPLWRGRGRGLHHKGRHGE